MSDINKALKLYDIMASRMEQNGFCSYQAAVYRETIELMKTCSTIEEATDKIKNSHLYLAPSAALVKDKLSALIRAANELYMPNVAAVYEEQLKKIESDVNSMYDSGYNSTAMNEKVKYIRAIEAFCDIYKSYFAICTAAPNDSELIESERENLNKAFGILEQGGVNFSEFAKLSEFRAMILSNDSGYEKFLSGSVALRQSSPDNSADSSLIDSEIKKAWDEVRAMKDEIVASGGEVMKKSAGISLVTVVPPSDAGGAYSYTDEEVQSYGN